MSNISPTASIASQPPVNFTPPPRQEQVKADVDKLTATAVKAETQKAVAPKQPGDRVDIRV